MRARHHRHDGGAHGLHVVGEVLDPGGVDDLHPHRRQQELANGVLEAMRRRQKRKIDLILQLEPAHHLGHSRDVRQDRTVRQHHPACRAGSAGGVDQTGEILRRNLRRRGDDIIWRLLRHERRRQIDFAVARIVDYQQMGQRCGRRRCRAQPGGQHAVAGDRNHRPRVAQDVRVVGDRVGGVGRHRDCAERHQRHFRHQQLGAIVGHHHHADSGRDRQFLQKPGARRGPAGEFAPAQTLPGTLGAMAQHRPFGPHAGASEQQTGKILGVGRVGHLLTL